MEVTVTRAASLTYTHKGPFIVTSNREEHGYVHNMRQEEMRGCECVMQMQTHTLNGKIIIST